MGGKAAAFLLVMTFMTVGFAGAEGSITTVTVFSVEGEEHQEAARPVPSSLESLAEDGFTEEGVQAQPEGPVTQARQDFIDGMLHLAEQKFEDANGRAQRAHYSGDIYVCKNFTVYLFRENAGAFRMAEFPTVPLIIPDNQKKADCKPYVYGVEWKEVSADQGNPFVAAASFRYDEGLSKAENRQKAREFLMQVQRGDYFQMAAKYYYGTGAHSMVFTADYDPATDSVHWTDSNMKGEKRGGERYGYVQYDAVKEIDWFVDAFCRKGYGATIYRLRDDIIYGE